MSLLRTSLAIAVSFMAIQSLASDGRNQTVEIGHHALNPAAISIGVGELVTFVNRVDMPGGHSVVADDSSFVSPPLAKNESWNQRFDRTGTFAYHVSEHPDTRGIITVKDVGNPKKAIDLH